MNTRSNPFVGSPAFSAMISAVAAGITKIKLSEEVVDPDDIETLEDLIMAATNEALRQMDEKAQSQMSKITGGMGGGMPF